MTPDNFARLQYNCRPAAIHKEWNSYDAVDFADTFLPHVSLIKAHGLYFYDGAALFDDLEQTDRAIFQLTAGNKLIRMIAFSYPTGVLAAKKIDKIELIPHEIYLFLELDQKDNITIQYKFGRYFIDFLEKQIGSLSAAYRLQEQKIHTTRIAFKDHFSNPLFLSDNF